MQPATFSYHCYALAPSVGTATAYTALKLTNKEQSQRSSTFFFFLRPSTFDWPVNPFNTLTPTPELWPDKEGQNICFSQSIFPPLYPLLLINHQGWKKMDFPLPIHSPSSWEALSLILGFSDGRNTLFTLQKKLLLEFAMEALDNGNCRQLGTLENQKQTKNDFKFPKILSLHNSNS